MKNVFLSVVILALVFVGLPLVGFKIYEYFAPRYAAVDRKVFENGQSYNEGMIRDFETLQTQYVNANNSQKQALRAIIIHRFSVYPQDRLPLNLRGFYNQLINERN